MDVNLDETKVLVFNKTGKSYKHEFKFNGKTLESIRIYKYLGVTVRFVFLDHFQLLHQNYTRKHSNVYSNLKVFSVLRIRPLQLLFIYLIIPYSQF